MKENRENNIAPDAIAYLDEAGDMGLSRNLTKQRDTSIGLMCALAFPSEQVNISREDFRPGFERFRAAAPKGAKLHMTEAFKEGNETWDEVGRQVRDEFLALIRQRQIPVIYDARRLRTQRERHRRLEALKESAKASRRSKIRVSDQPSKDRVEEELMIGMVLKLDALAEDCGRKKIAIYFDEIDKNLARLYRTVIDQTRSVSRTETEVKGWDPETKKQLAGKFTITVQSPIPLDVRFVGEIKVVGKGDPLVLAVDIVANSLLDHLRGLAPEAHLNRPSSVHGWALEDRVYGVRDDAIEDLI